MKKPEAKNLVTLSLKQQVFTANAETANGQAEWSMRQRALRPNLVVLSL
jgi:hypothetical protein